MSEQNWQVLFFVFYSRLADIMESLDRVMPEDAGPVWMQLKETIGYIETINDALMGKPISLPGNMGPRKKKK